MTMRDAVTLADTLRDAGLYALPCACANVRRLARVMTRRYDAALKPAGLEVTQFSLLSVLAVGGDATHGVLNRGFAMDSTTLTRTLALMASRGWIAAASGPDRRTRVYRITAAGRRRVEQARPYWRRAQRDIAASVGAPAWTTLLHDAPAMTATIDVGAPRRAQTGRRRRLSGVSRRARPASRGGPS